MSAAPRLGWQDALRGLGIALVVLGHVERGLRGAGLLPEHGWAALDFAIYAFHMPLFMAVAGLNVPGSLARGTGRFLRGRLVTIGLPYVIWSVVQAGVLAAGAGVTNHAPVPNLLVALAWFPVPPFWFLYALLVYALVVMLLPVRWLLVLALGTYGCAAAFWPTDIRHQLLHYLLWFVAGMALAPLRERLAMLLPTFVGLIAGALGVAGLVMAWRMGIDDPNAVVLAPVTAMLLVAALALAPWLAQLPGLVPLGIASLTIYVTHVIAAAGVRIVLHRVLHWPAMPVLDVASGWLAGLALPFVVHRWLGARGWLPWLGLGVSARQRRWIEGLSPDALISNQRIRR